MEMEIEISPKLDRHRWDSQRDKDRDRLELTGSSVFAKGYSIGETIGVSIHIHPTFPFPLPLQFPLSVPIAVF